MCIGREEPYPWKAWLKYKGGDVTHNVFLQTKGDSSIFAITGQDVYIGVEEKWGRYRELL